MVFASHIDLADYLTFTCRVQQHSGGVFSGGVFLKMAPDNDESFRGHGDFTW